jgi:hypothetical protein
LYEKFSLFLEEFDKVWKNLEIAQKSFENSKLKLYLWNKNIISTLEKIRQTAWFFPKKSLVKK